MKKIETIKSAVLEKAKAAIITANITNPKIYLTIFVSIC